MGNYSYSRKIVVDNTKVAETDTEFAVLLNLTAAGSGVLAYLATTGNGGKIENTAAGGASGTYTVPADFTFRTTADLSEAGASLDFEIEYYDAATGAMIAWVQCGVNSGADVVFYMIYGNADVVASQEDVNGTWDASFYGVWHLNESAGHAIDSTSYGNDSTVEVLESRDSDGQISKLSPEYTSADDDRLTWPDDPDLDTGAGSMLLELWFKRDSAQDPIGSMVLCTKQHDGDPYTRYGLSWEVDTLYFVIDDGPDHALSSIAAPSKDVWSYIVGQRDGDDVYVFLNAVRGVLGDGSAVGNIDNDGLFVVGANRPGGWLSSAGWFDEARLSKAARSVNWISTVYANQSSPATFYHVGTDYAQSLAGSSAHAGQILKKTATTKVGGLTGSGAVYKLTLTVLTGALTFTADILAESFAIFTGAITFTGTLGRKVCKSLAGAFTGSGTAGRGRFAPILTGALTSAGVLLVKGCKFISGAVTFVGTLLRDHTSSSASYRYKIDVVSTGMAYLEDVISVAPAGVRFRHHPIVHVAGDGVGLGTGYPQCEWLFDYLSWTDLGTMLAYLGTKESVSLYINTRRPDDTYQKYSAVMHRPRVPSEATQVIGGWRNVIFRFTHLETV